MMINVNNNKQRQLITTIILLLFTKQLTQYKISSQSYNIPITTIIITTIIIQHLCTDNERMIRGVVNEQSRRETEID